MRTSRIRFGWQLPILVLLISLWLALAGLFILSRGNPEAVLLERLGRYSRPDAFEGVNAILPVFCFMHTVLVLMAIAAARLHRMDVSVILGIGPLIALVLNLFYEEWMDPNWYDVLAIASIGWLVSSSVGCVYWALRPVATNRG